MARRMCPQILDRNDSMAIALPSLYNQGTLTSLKKKETIIILPKRNWSRYFGDEVLSEYKKSLKK